MITVEQLRKDRANAIALMSKSWQHNHEQYPDLLTRYVAMAITQFDKLDEAKAQLNKCLIELEKYSKNTSCVKETRELLEKLL